MASPFDPTFDRAAPETTVKEVTVATVQGQRGSQEDAHLIHCFAPSEEEDGAGAAHAGKCAVMAIHLIRSRELRSPVFPSRLPVDDVVCVCVYFLSPA